MDLSANLQAKEHDLSAFGSSFSKEFESADSIREASIEFGDATVPNQLLHGRSHVPHRGTAGANGY